MAYAKLYLKNPYTGTVREAPVGFSWTVLFFGFFPPVFRSDWRGFVMIFLFWLFAPVLSNFIFMFIYNRMYLKSLIRDGFQVAGGTTDVDAIQQRTGIPLPRLFLAA